MRNQNRCGADSDKKRGYRTLRFYSYSYSVIGAPCSIRAAAGHVAIIISISGYQPRPPAVLRFGQVATATAAAAATRHKCLQTPLTLAYSLIRLSSSSSPCWLLPLDLPHA